jgi:Protein of unknown function (DUF760)
MFEIQDPSSNNNPLIAYLRSQSPETLEQVAKHVTPEVRQIISQNIQGLVGMLPSNHFQISVTTNHENLGNLLGSAMMTGYFLSQMETRMKLDRTLLDDEVEPEPVTAEQSDDFNGFTDFKAPEEHY